MTDALLDTRIFQCGPTTIALGAASEWVARLSGELLQYDLPFEGMADATHVEIIEGTSPPPAVKGRYLRCSRFVVDRVDDELRMLGPSGAWCKFDERTRRAQAYAPHTGAAVREELQEFLLFLTVGGWRRAGWTPFHAATIERHGRCALICAESGGGKSTFTAACVRQGFKTLGDDKVLMSRGNPALARGVASTMNLDPAIAAWFPEARGVAEIAPYSPWTNKRRTGIEKLWPGALLREAVPTMLFKLTRCEQAAAISLAPLPAAETLEVIARQTVIPRDRAAAAVILPTIAQLAQQLQGWSLNIPPDAYANPLHLAAVEELHMSVRVSVIVPVLNGAATLGDMLAALMAQKGAGETEVLVVDNGSTDRTVDIARQFPVTLLHEPTPGTSAARNAALRVAQGEFVACLDADTLPTRRWLCELLRPFDNPAIMIVAGKVLTYNPSNAIEMYYDACDMYGSRHNVYAKVFQFAVGMNAAVRTSVAREVGGWEQSLLWGEDIDFSERILRRFPDALAYAEKALLFHRHRSTHEALVRQALGYGRGAAMIHQRYPDKSTWRAFSPLIVAGCVAGRWANASAATARRLLGRMDPTRAAITYCHALWSWHFWRGFFIEYYWLQTHKRT